MSISIPLGPAKYDEQGRMLHPFFGTPMVEVEPGKWRDPVAVAIDESMHRVMQAGIELMMREMRFSRYPKGPWPSAGYDFRLNANGNRYPYEPERCETCGHVLDDDDDW